ncbi:MAG: biotin synthase BioB [Candidatus Omnitrophica bacterium]|nr:biotin synthase BioB [Candidatus Omnitrophota bacterium]
MDTPFYLELAGQSMAGRLLPRAIAKDILSAGNIDLMPLLDAAYTVRKTFFGKQVTIHIINNAQNGYCSEDCRYCAQAKSSEADITEYPVKSDEEILLEAKNAYEKGAYRYCMVFAGRGPSQGRIERLARLIREIKSRYHIEVCVSAGLLDQEKARVLAQAGLDRLNHNLNTSARYYPQICTTHTFEDRLNTLKAARQAGLQICSGVIIGMGEEIEDVLDMAYTLRDQKAESIPVNFFIPIKGTRITRRPDLSPGYCLRVLCLFRFLNPEADIRIAAGREVYLRSMEVMALYPANSLFLDGYLNAKGDERIRTLRMIKDAGFSIESDHSLDELIANEAENSKPLFTGQGAEALIKDLKDLRPHLSHGK